jgi:hypothetical protein
MVLVKYFCTAIIITPSNCHIYNDPVFLREEEKEKIRRPWKRVVGLTESY